MRNTVIGLLFCLALAAGDALADNDWAGRSDTSLLEEARSLVANKSMLLWEPGASDLLLELAGRWQALPTPRDGQLIADVFDRREPVDAAQAALQAEAYELLGDLFARDAKDKNEKVAALAALRRAEWIATTHLPKDASRNVRLATKIDALSAQSVDAPASEDDRPAPVSSGDFAATEFERLFAARHSLPETEVFLQSGHSGAVIRLTWSPDGAFIVTTSWDNTLKLWDVATRRLVYTYRGHGSAVNAAALTPDGEWLVTAGAQPDGSLHVIERRSGRLLRRLVGHASGVQDVALLSGGGRALSVSDQGGETILWDLRSGALLRKYQFEDVGNLRSVAVLPDGNRAIIGGYNGHIALVSLDESRVLRRYAKQEREVAQIVVHPDGKSFYTASGGTLGQGVGQGTLLRWPVDGDAPQVRFTGPAANLWGMAISPDGQQVAAGGGDSALGSFGSGETEHVLWVWRADSGELQLRLPLSERWRGRGVRALAFSPDGKRLAYTSDSDNGIVVRTLSAQAGTQRFEGRLFARRLLTAPEDGAAWLSVSIDDPALAERRRKGGDLRSPAPTKSRILDGVYRLMRWNPLSGEREETVDLHKSNIKLLSSVGVFTLSFSEDHFWGDDFNALHVVVTSPKMGQLQKRISPRFRKDVFIEEEIMAGSVLMEKAMALSRQGRYLAIVYSKGQLFKSDYFVAIFEKNEDGYSLLKRLPVAHPVTALAFAADENRLLAGICDERNERGLDCDESKGVRLHCADIEAGKWVAQSQATTRKINEIRVSPDGAFALTTGANAIAWKTDDCRILGELWVGDRRNTRAGAWSSDQKRIAFASGGRRIHLWDTDKMALERSLIGFDGNVEQLAFTPDSKTLLALTDDGALRLWDPDTGALRATMIEFDDGEWMTVIPEGYFMGSPDADRQLSVRYGDRVYGMDQFYDLFYRPDIVRRKLAGEKIDDLIRTTLDNAVRRPPPRVAVAVQPDADGRVRLKLEANDAGGGVGALRVYHNGKLVASDDSPRTAPQGASPRPAAQSAEAIRGLLAAEARRTRPAAPEPQRLKEVDIRLAPGENRVWVTGMNADGSLRSRPVMVGLPHRPEQPARVFVLALGVDRYRNARDIPTLRYAVKDARAFSREMRERLAKVFPQQPVEVHYLENDKATLANLQATLERLQGEMRPGDVFVWFIASHGLLDDNSAYNVVLHDADLDQPGRGVLPADRLLEWLKRLPALDQMIVIDTCHAGGLDGTVRGLYDARFGVLARSMGLHILASASATEEAIDGYKGNGLFTHSMLRAMGDPGSDSNADGRLSATELGRYARTLTRQIAKEMRFSQNPLAFHFGRDMVIAEFADRR
ncbi:MAG: PD40 domain-containing protein [Zoogloeaceae bacterium]|nr:PD40 domain-containing protein [Zoogloeaceae bacterium]